MTVYLPVSSVSGALVVGWLGGWFLIIHHQSLPT